MNVIDILLIAIVLLAAWSGWQKGFILGMRDLLVWIGSLVIAFITYPYAASFIEKYFPSLNVWTLPVAFLAMLIISRILLSILSGRLLRTIPQEAHVRHENRVLGLIPGLINGAIYATIIAALLLAFPLFDGLSTQTRNSPIASRLAQQVEWIDDKLSPVFDKALNQTMNKLTVHPNSDETVKLPYSVKSPKVREDLEAKMLDLVNEERRKEGLQPLKADPELAVVARAHSRDMFARSYFSHITPEGKSPFDRMRTAGVRFLTAGENLALAQTLSIAHTGLMNSPGHRANILNKSFGRVGIGVLDGGMYGLMITQNFRN
ncbi:MAG: CvpA family protein [Flavisolibacter sp.]|nr:CvpA family protein [Flavisolibacter sp.]